MMMYPPLGTRGASIVAAVVACSLTTPFAAGESGAHLGDGPRGAQHDWPQFRGPTGQGHATATGLPLTWSETEYVAWKVPVAGRGWSSPVISGEQIWLTTALEKGHELRAVCFHMQTGAVLYDVEVFHKEDPRKIHAKNSHASPTPIIDGDRIYVHYGAHGTACLTDQGEVVWRKELEYDPQHGPGGSPALIGDLLVINCDGSDEQFVVALDKRTGETRWRQNRDTRQAYSTPLAIEVDGRLQVICVGADRTVSYDPLSGAEIWWCTYDGYSNVPRPVYGNGLVFICTGFNSPTVMAVRPDGKGDVTETHVAWQLERGAPLNPSPILAGDELYLVSDKGVASCIDARSGEVHWQRRLGGNFSASPIYAEGRVYFINEDGASTVVAAATEYEVLATGDLDGRVQASPAVADGAIFLRTETHLYRIERP